MPSDSVGEYWDQQVAMLRSLSVEVDHQHTRLDEYPGGKAGAVRSHLLMSEEGCYLAVYERIRLVKRYVERLQYSYHLRFDNRDVGRWDFDPDHPMADLRHHINLPTLSPDSHVPFTRISLTEAVTISWKAYSEWSANGRSASAIDLPALSWRELNESGENLGESPP